MSGQPTRREYLIDELETDAKHLDRGCRSRLWGLTGTMFRTAKYLFYIATLATSTYLVEYAGVEPALVMAFAALLITGPEGLEAWLIRVGKMDTRDGGTDSSDD